MMMITMTGDDNNDDNRLKPNELCWHLFTAVELTYDYKEKTAWFLEYFPSYQRDSWPHESLYLVGP